MTLTSGTVVSHYRVIEQIGAGGMGEVYRAHDERLGRDVAIKVLSPNLAATPEARARFEREARTISQLTHPHICTLYDIGHQDGMDYLVMELLEGETLADRLEKGPLPLVEVLSLGSQIAAALDRAHRAGVVHRDLKPGNVMLTKSGAKLMDFGLARASTVSPMAGAEADSPTMSRPLTSEGTIVGTFQYMAPEQLEGKDADARTDIWALGCVLYEMATGRLAFEGGSSASLISAIMKDEPRPILDLQPLTPPALERIVKHCLEKDPDERFQSARDLAFDLGTLSKVAEGGPRMERCPVRREILAWGIAGLAVVGAVVLAMALRGKGPRAPEPVISYILPPANSVSCFRDGFALSPDGRKLAFVSLSEQGERQVWLRRLDRPEAAPIPGTDDASYPFWSPDSKAIAFYAGGQLKRASTDGGPVQTICQAELVGSGGGSWGSDGVILFTDVNSHVSRVPAGGGEPIRVSMDPASFPCFLPDGRRFLYVHGYFHRQSAESPVYLASLDVPGPGREVTGTGGAARVEWASGDRLVLWLFADRSLVAQRVDLGSCRVVGARDQLAERVPYPGDWPLFSLSPAGIVAFVVNPPEARNDYASRLVWVDRAGNQVGSLGEVGGYWYARISPDGRRVAVNPDDDTWIMDTATGVPTRLTMEMNKGGAAARLVWSPAGDRAAIFMGYDGTVREFTVPGGQSREIYKGLWATDWSRDGRYLAIDQWGDAGTLDDLAYFDLADRQLKPFLAGAAREFGGTFSPDGHWVAYTSNETGSFEVYLRAFPGGDRLTRVSRAGGMHPRWRADGRELFFLAPGWTMMAVPVQLQPGLEIGAPKPLFRMVMADFVKGFFLPYDVAPDGQRFLVISPQTKPVPLTLVQNWSALVDR